jgi:hypothetical protein
MRKILIITGTLLGLGTMCALITGAASHFTGPLILETHDAGTSCSTATGAGSLCAAGDVEAEDDFDVGDDLTVGDDAAISGLATVGETLGVTGATTLSSTLAVTGATTLTGALTTNGEAIRSPAYTITFDEGASKGATLLQSDATAYDKTADVLNHLYYGSTGAILAVIHETTNTGATPTAEATGLDIGQGGADNDVIELLGGVFGASGRPFVVGTDAAFKFCADLTIADVSGTDLFFCGFRTVEVVDAIAQYADFAAIGIISGDIYVTDTTTGDTDTTDNWADTANKEICTLVSAAGVVTYTIAGAAPTSTDAHTIGDGLQVIPFCQKEEDSDLAEDTHLISWTVAYQ